MPLVDSSEWKSAEIELSKLRFHPKNPRVPLVPDGASEREIISALVASEKVDVIAKSIADKGYLRQDRLIVLKEEGKFNVYEGNRRLCALKLLDNPDLAPTEAIRKVYQNLASRAGLPKKIAVEIVPNKFHAEVVMYTKHASAEFSRNWRPLQQAMFITDKLSDGHSEEDLDTQLGIKPAEIQNARAAIEVYKLAVRAELSDEARKLAEDPSEFPYSTIFQRIIQPKEIAKTIGVEIGKSGLKIKGDPEDFVKFLGTLLENSTLPSDDPMHLDTRKVNKTKDVQDYLKKVGYKPTGNVVTLACEVLGGSNDKNADKSSESQKAGNKAASNRGAGVNRKLFSRGLTLEYEHEKLSRLLKEGKKLEIKGNEHAAAFLLRSTLEIAWKAHGRKKKVKVTPSNKNMPPSLQDYIGHTLGNLEQWGFTKSEKSAVEQLNTTRSQQSKAQMDKIVHDEHVVATEDIVINLREAAFPVLTALLKKP